MLQDYFSVQVFFIIFRETLETAIIVSVLMAFLHQGLDDNKILAERTVYRRLVAQIWIGAALGLLVCLIVGGVFIFSFYYLGKNLWNSTEKLWEAIFSIVASVMITIMGLAMLRLNSMREKWRFKIAKIIVRTAEDTNHKAGLKSFSRRYAMALLPFVTTLREGLEAVIFLGGIGINEPMSSFPLAALAGVALGAAVGIVMYKSGNHFSVHYFLIAATCFLYLVAAGLFSRGVWFFELQQFLNKVGMDVSEMGSGPGSYDVTNVVWHVNCCNAQTDGPWMIFNALLGWQNTATYGSVISYNLYWLCVMLMILAMHCKQTYGYIPLLPKGWQDRRKAKKAKHIPQTQEEREALLRQARLAYSADAQAADEETSVARASVDSDTPLVSR